MAASRTGSLTVEELSRALRETRGPEMRNRRWIAGLSLFSTAVMSGIGLYQLGIIRDIPEPPLCWFDAKKVNGSAQAYSILKTPDALLGAMNYAATACLAGVGSPDRATTTPWIPIAMGAKLAGDALVAGKLTVDQWTKHRAFSMWCLLTAGATFAAAALGVRETAAAVRRIADEIAACARAGR